MTELATVSKDIEEESELETESVEIEEEVEYATTQKAIVEEAVYTEQVIRNYQGNPLIEALPDILTPKQFLRVASFLPEIREEDRELLPTYRAHMIDSLDEFFKPLSFHVEIEQRISRMIRHGYINKNPYMDIKRQIDVEDVKIKYGVKKTKNSTVAELGIFGISGMGKTTLINKVLSLYPQMILHTNYKGDKTIRYQIPWLKVEVPSKINIKSLSLRILKQIDDLFGQENYYKKGNSKREYEQLEYLKDIFEIHSVGLLVIDEIQNISGIASKDSDKIMKFFVELSNVITVPIVLIGTLKALPLFEKEMKNCRRIADSRPMYKAENDDEWKAFMKALFKNQWTKHPVEPTEELINLIYEESQGITDIAVKLFKFAQLRAIYTEVDKITVNIIKSVAKDSLLPLKPLLQALRSNKKKLLMRYEDLYDSRHYFDKFSQQEKNRVETCAWNEVGADQEEENDKEFYVRRTVSLFLTQAGIPLKTSEKCAKEAIKKNGIDTDVAILKKYAFELSLKKQSEDEKKKEEQLTEKEKIKVKGKAGAKSEGDNVDGYQSLKDEGLIGSAEEFA